MHTFNKTLAAWWIKEYVAFLAYMGSFWYAYVQCTCNWSIIDNTVTFFLMSRFSISQFWAWLSSSIRFMFSFIVCLNICQFDYVLHVAPFPFWFFVCRSLNIIISTNLNHFISAILTAVDRCCFCAGFDGSLVTVKQYIQKSANFGI